MASELVSWNKEGNIANVLASVMETNVNIQRRNGRKGRVLPLESQILSLQVTQLMRKNKHKDLLAQPNYLELMSP